MIFYPKRDRWLSILMWGVVVLLVLCGLSPLIIAGSGIIVGTFVFIIGFGMAALVAHIWTSIIYVFQDDGLFIRSWPTKEVIPYEAITSVTSIRSWLTQPAASSDRLEIKYGRFGSLHISPLEREKFLAELGQRCPHMSIEKPSDTSHA